MSMSNDTAARMAASALVAEPRRGMVRRTVAVIPMFAYFLIIYIILEVSVPDVRSIIFSIGGYALTWVEVMYLVATFMAMGELLRVSKPGIDNTKEALWMLGVGIVYLVLFILGATGASAFKIFSNTEFLMIGLLSGCQIVLAFMINARTLKRTIDYTTDNGHHA